MERKDRTLNEHRKIFSKVGVVSKAKGSAYLEMGDTKVIVSVYEPKEIARQTEYNEVGILVCDFKYAPFLSDKSEATENRYANLMQISLEPAVCLQEFPNLQIDVYAFVLDDHGSALSAAINCAGLAIAHAAIPMYDIVSSVTIGFQSNQVFLDPDYYEEQLCLSSASTRAPNHQMDITCFDDVQKKTLSSTLSKIEPNFTLNFKKGWDEVRSSVCNLLLCDTMTLNANQTNKTINCDENRKQVCEHGLITVANLGTQDQLSLLHQTGHLSLSQIENAMTISLKHSKDIGQLLKKALVQFVMCHLDKDV